METGKEENMKHVTFAFVALALAMWCCAAADVTDLPEAVFDRGGNTFDFEAISAKRFPVPAGEFSGRAARLKDTDPFKPVVYVQLTTNYNF